jgi:7-carboxy-7-deazaguanine synthase
VLISEIFHSIQGEGELTGVPSVFVRTAGCNLRCQWCDTPYASWDPEGVERSIEDIVRQISVFRCGHVVITGGEPMIAKGIRDLTARLRESGQHITIESAGTIAPDGIACDLASISPKLRNSTPEPGTIADSWVGRHEASRWKPDAVRAWIEQYPFQLKFVVSSATDVEEIQRMIGEVGGAVPPHKILLMPEGTEAGTLRERQKTLAGICKVKGFRLCQRLHIELYGNTRGT